MKIKNYSHCPVGENYVGLNAGTASVGWAVTEPNGELAKWHGKHLWGVIGYNEASGTQDQRTARIARRALQRRHQRLRWLEEIFAQAITEGDPNFFHRFHESGLVQEDRKLKNRFVLFNDEGYTDANYFTQYPTIYHLRQDLIYNQEEHDVRLVFLALHHLLKYRGHLFLKTDMSGTDSTEDTIKQLSAVCEDVQGVPFRVKDPEAFISIMGDSELNVTSRKKKLRELVEDADAAFSMSALCDLLAGATVKLSKIFPDAELESADSINLNNDLSEQEDALAALLGDNAEILLAAQAVSDAIKLRALLGDSKYLCDAKVRLYGKNKADKLLLRAYIRAHAPEKYAKIMKKRTKKEGKGQIPNYQAYIGKGESGDYRCTQEEFCAFLKKELPKYTGNDQRFIRMFSEIEGGTFLTRLHSKENRLIPYQIHKRELTAILDNASGYLPFLTETDDSGITAREKIVSIFEYQIPYYVGPLGKSPRAWCVRRESGPITPWNIDKKIDMEASAKQFIDRLTGRCTYTGEPVLPDNSLIYSEFKLLNALNPLRINGNLLSAQKKQQMIQDLFAAAKGKVKKEKIERYMLSMGWMEPGDVVTGISDTITSTMKSRIEMEPVMNQLGGIEGAEAVIAAITCFGSNKQLLNNWLEGNFPKLSKEDRRYLCSLSYTGWGNLSNYFLTSLYSADKNGEAFSIMDLMRNTSNNLIQLLASDYEFSDKAQTHLTSVIGEDPTLEEYLDYMYVSAPAKRTIHQLAKLMEELTETTGKAPAKVFLGVARDNKTQGKAPEDRKKKLQSIYSENKKWIASVSPNIAAELEKEDEENLQKDRVYLYYLQLGLCLYTGARIPRTEADNPIHYNTEHIFPKSKVRDDSFDNCILVDAKVNKTRDQTYPLPKAIRDNMVHTWKAFRGAGLMSESKYERLTRDTELTTAELSAFVARQLNDTRQSTKAAAVVLRRMFPNTKIVLVKDINVALFRKEYGLVKNRNINDLHNATDAYLNIRVGEVYDVLFSKEFFDDPKKYDYSINTKAIFGRPVKNAWDPKLSLAQVERTLRLHDQLVTRRQFEATTLYKVTIQSAGSGQVPKKQGMDVQKYGGYSSIGSAYYCIVEHTDSKGRRIRTIEPVYSYMRKQFEKDPITYCRDTLGLTEPVLLRDKLMFDSLLEIDGKRYRIGGRSGNTIILRHAYSLIVSPEQEKLLKAVQRYVDRCTLKRKDLPLTENSGFTDDDLNGLYRLFQDKLDAKPYAGLFGMLPTHMKNNEETFKLLEPTNKARVILQILKAFIPNPECPNLSILCGVSLCGRIQINKQIKPEDHFAVIDHSVSGLRERKTLF